MNYSKEMTVAEAVAAGYQHYGFTNLEGKLFHLCDIAQDSDFPTATNGEFFLYAIEESHPSVDHERIQEDILNDTIVNCEVDGIEDSIEDAFTKADINWQEIADKINKELESVIYYEAANIKLIP